jgi:hypothetical protein
MGVTWVQTHPRQGHFRNGSWIQGTTVHGYYRTYVNAQPDAASDHRRRRSDQHVKNREHTQQIASLYVDVLDEGWQKAVTDRAVDSATEAAWQQLFRQHRDRDCTELAHLAAHLLHVPDMMGDAASEITKRAGGGPIVQAFAHKLASRLPLGPLGAHIVAVARGLQITGILICVIDERPLTQCPCFIDLTLAETRTRAKELLTAATADWTGLEGLPFSAAQPASQDSRSHPGDPR